MWFQCRDTGVALPVAGGYGLFALPVADACQSNAWLLLGILGNELRFKLWVFSVVLPSVPVWCSINVPPHNPVTLIAGIFAGPRSTIGELKPESIATLVRKLRVGPSSCRVSRYWSRTQLCRILVLK